MCSFNHSISFRAEYTNSSTSCSTSSLACLLSPKNHCADPTGTFARVAVMTSKLFQNTRLDGEVGIAGSQSKLFLVVYMYIGSPIEVNKRCSRSKSLREARTVIVVCLGAIVLRRSRGTRTGRGCQDSRLNRQITWGRCLHRLHSPSVYRLFGNSP